MAATDTGILRSKSGAKAYKLFGGGGLHQLVTPSGGRLWRWKCRFEGTVRQLALCSYPTVPLAGAREHQAAVRKRLANGIDPMAERKAGKTAVTVATESTPPTPLNG